MVQSIWSFYKSSSDPVRQACVAEWQGWLAEVRRDSERKGLRDRLQSSKPEDHFSARLELYFHHHFKSQGFRVDFHPTLEDSTEHPDFLVHHECGPFYLEVTTRGEEHWLIDQQEFADRLKAELACIPSRHRVSVEILEPCPKVRFLPEIKNFLEQQLLAFETGDEEEKDVVWKKSEYGRLYELRFSLYRRSGLCERLRAFPITCGGMSDIVRLLYDAVDGKARKYGTLDLPLVIAVWGLSFPDPSAWEMALYGELGLRFCRDHYGNAVSKSVESGTLSNGVFTVREDGKLRNPKVSAVAIYEHRLADTNHRHVLRVYHNPFALKSLPQKVFEGVSQLVPVPIYEMRWINGEPDDA